MERTEEERLRESSESSELSSKEPAKRGNKITPEQRRRYKAAARLKKEEEERRRLQAEGLEVPVAEDGASEELKAFRHVQVNDEKYDRTEGQRTARRFKAKSYKSFLEMLNKMEEDHRSVRGEKARGEVDGGVERCVALIEKLLGKDVK